MCVIAHKRHGAILPDLTVDKCWAKHSDGAGFVWIPKKGAEIVVEKGIMTLKEFKEKTIEMRKAPGNLVCHFRYQTRGGKIARLTHPFDFSTPEKKRFLFHNGTIKWIREDAGDSDSSTLGELLKNLSDEDALELLKSVRDKTNNEQFGNKFVVILGSEIEVIENKESETKKGVWFSNLRHEVADSKAADTDCGNGYCGAPNVATHTKTSSKWALERYEHDRHGYSEDEINFSSSSKKKLDGDGSNLSGNSSPEEIKRKREIGSTASFKLASLNCAGCDPDITPSYAKQLMFDYNFEDWSDEDINLLKSFTDDETNDNPLCSYFLAKNKKTA